MFDGINWNLFIEVKKNNLRTDCAVWSECHKFNVIS